MSKFYIGQKASIIKSFTIEELIFYCQRISHDNNPIHLLKKNAIENGFQNCIVPGPMISSLFGGLLGSKLPGNNTIYLGHETKFIGPILVEEIIKAEIEILHIRLDKPIITFSTKVIKQNGEIAVDGTAVVKANV